MEGTLGLLLLSTVLVATFGLVHAHWHRLACGRALFEKAHAGLVDGTHRGLVRQGEWWVAERTCGGATERVAFWAMEAEAVSAAPVDIP
jgi:hypothetical protein